MQSRNINNKPQYNLQFGQQEGNSDFGGLSVFGQVARAIYLFAFPFGNLFAFPMAAQLFAWVPQPLSIVTEIKVDPRLAGFPVDDGANCNGTR